MTEADSVTLRIDGVRAVLTLNRPERHNAIGFAEMSALRRACDAIDAEPDLRVAILTGSGDKTFCAGASLQDVAEGDWSDNPFEALCDRLESLRVPVICALNGSVYGGGGELALACDFRIGVEGMRLMVPPARLGIHYPLIGLRRYVERLGLGAAKRVLLACESFDAAELKAIGFLDHLVPSSELVARTDALASQIAELAPLSVQGMKRSLNEIARGTLDREAAQDRIARCWRSADHQEGLRAHAEKRRPAFEGR